MFLSIEIKTFFLLILATFNTGDDFDYFKSVIEDYSVSSSRNNRVQSNSIYLKDYFETPENEGQLSSDTAVLSESRPPPSISTTTSTTISTTISTSTFHLGQGDRGGGLNCDDRVDYEYYDIPCTVETSTITRALESDALAPLRRKCR